VVEQPAGGAPAFALGFRRVDQLGGVGAEQIVATEPAGRRLVDQVRTRQGGQQ
jgi:hypothetical protein